MREGASSSRANSAVRRGRRALLGGRPRDHLMALLAVGASVVLCAALERWLPVSIASFSLIFLSAVLVVAVRTALAPALTTAVFGFLAYNYFFTTPRYSFEITRPDELVAVALFLVMGLAGGNLADRIRRQVAALEATNEQSRKLLLLNERLSAAGEPGAIHRLAVETIAEFSGAPACILVETDAGVEIAATSQPGGAPGASLCRDLLGRAQAGTNGQSEVAGESGARWYVLALVVGERRHGALLLRLDRLDHEPVPAELQLFAAYASQVAQALTRTGLTARLEEARVAEETERLRAALLSSVSHDLRTPLASMIGAASSLRDLGAQLSAADRLELLDSLLSEGHRLDRYIENLLDMTRLGHGAFRLERDWVAPADLLASAMRRTREQFPELVIEHDVPRDAPLLYAHSALVEQAIFNVLENAARFSPPGRPVRIRVSVDGEELVIRVSDEGRGMQEEELGRVFDMFYSGTDTEGHRYGSGLGLAICRGMLAAHGGSVAAQVGDDGRGTTIEMRLPVAEVPPEAMPGGAS